MSGLLQVLFCNCCGTDCDCGCAETCRLLDHRPPTDQNAAESSGSDLEAEVGRDE